jgi:Putative Ig domain
MKRSITITSNATVLAATLFLAACGGGGGGGDVTPPVVPPVNRAPTISGVPDAEINVGKLYSFTPVASDPDGDTLTFSVSNAPAWAVFSPSTGTLDGIPSSVNIGDFADIVISVSDGSATDSLPPYAITVSPKIIGRDDFKTEGDLIPSDDGYRSVGTLTMDLGDFEQEFQNSDLQLRFDEEGNLIDLLGETDLPTSVSNNISLDAGVKAIVGMMKGSEINADEDFGITLMEDTNYFVYYIGTSFNMVVGDRDDPSITESVTIETPLNSQTIMILDPTDAFVYNFKGTAAGDYGSGESDHGLIPYFPELNFAELDSFNGHIIEKGAMGVGIKIFDFFEIGGTRVTKQPQFADIDWDDPLNSPIEYKAGMNGYADFAFSIAGFGFLSFELAETSATFDVGLDRQHMAMSLQLEPEYPLMPPLFNIQPLNKLTGSAFVNGQGDYGFELGGVWHCTLPEADINGTLLIDNGAVGMEGSVTEGDTTLVVSLDFFNDQTTGRVEFPETFAQGITGIVSEGLDRKLDEVEQAISDLEDAVADYEFEVSLRGLRESLPAIADEGTREANSVPDSARNHARTNTLSYLRNTCKTYTVLGQSITRCLDDLLDDPQAIADDAGDKAHSEALDAIRAPKAALAEMKRRALEADGETVRDALESSLIGAYNNRNARVQVKVTRRFGFPFDATYTLYERDTNYTILDTATADQIKAAADNVYRISETDSIVINSQQILDQLPTEEVIESVRSEVNEGVAAVPTVDGLGYMAIGDSYSAFATIDGEDMVMPINVLKPSEVREGVGDLLTELLLNPIN